MKTVLFWVVSFFIMMLSVEALSFMFWGSLTVFLFTSYNLSKDGNE